MITAFIFSGINSDYITAVFTAFISSGINFYYITAFFTALLRILFLQDAHKQEWINNSDRTTIRQSSVLLQHYCSIIVASLLYYCRITAVLLLHYYCSNYTYIYIYALVGHVLLHLGGARAPPGASRTCNGTQTEQH